MKEIQIEKIHLANWNPRFNNINKMNYDFVDKFTKMDKNYSLETEINIIAELLNDDYNSFLELFQSISKKCYLPLHNHLYLIKNKENYIVIDGNRRVACIKLLKNYQKYYEYIDKYLKNNNNNKNSYTKKLTELFEFINSQIISKDISKFNIKDTLSTSEYELRSNNLDISNLIFAKNQNQNEQVGGLNWRIGKYYYDIWTIFNNEKWFKTSDFEKTDARILFNRFSKELYRDYKQSALIIQYLNSLKISEKDLEYEIRNIKEVEHLTIKNINYLIKQILYSLNRKLKTEKYINLKFDETKRKYINLGVLDIDKIFYFINESIKKQYLLNDLTICRLWDANKFFEKIFNISEPVLIQTKKDFMENFNFLSESELKRLKNEVKDENILKLIVLRLQYFNYSEIIIKQLYNMNAHNILTFLFPEKEQNENKLVEFSSLFAKDTAKYSKLVLEFILKMIIYEALKSKENYNKVEHISFYNKVINKMNNKLISTFEIFDNDLISIFYNRILPTELSELKNRNDIFGNKIFNDTFKTFFNEEIDVYKILNFIDKLNNAPRIFNLNIHTGDFNKHVKSICEIIKNNNNILKDLLHIICGIRRNSKIKIIFNELTENAYTDEWNDTLI
ncbi:hypothetical protein [Mycoplasma phage MGyu-2021a]|uniref:DUF262 domain-containing protein n=1 Tax=Mycoplasma anserisalpingitidis TaxID=519450 RepID=A0A8F2E4G6_9MOLU|nr:hypothetical protein [Mycoplasma phage MGyu-2021a]QWT28830.1 hypothetical protein [Mycoplasma anserisalpingitidis]